MKKILLFAFALITTPQFAQSWVQIADLPTGRHHPVTFALDGMGYAATGSNSFGQPTKDFYQYDPVSDDWDTLADFPGTARSFGIGTVLDGKGYLGFGATLTQYLRDLWRYDAQADQWIQLAPCPCSGRRHPAMIAIDNKIYVGLGDDATGDLKDWWMYNVTTDSWIQLADLPGPGRHHPFMFNAGGEIFAGMGHSGPSIYTDWYKLDTAANTWTAMQNFPGEGRVAGTQFNWNNAGFVLSGDGDNHSFMPSGEMWRYIPATDSWTEFPPHPGISLWAPGSFVIDNEVYFFGGRNRQNAQYPTDAWKFDLQAGTVSLEEQALAKLSVYPNPATDMLHWNYTKDITEVELVNSLGQVLLKTSAQAELMDISALKAGVYLIKFNSETKNLKTVKVVKH